MVRRLGFACLAVEQPERNDAVERREDSTGPRDMERGEVEEISGSGLDPTVSRVTLSA